MEYDSNSFEALVIPVSETVILPGVNTIFSITGASGALARALRDGGKAAALPLRRDVSGRQPAEDDFFRLGVSFEVTDVTDSEDGVLVHGRAGGRVEAVSIRAGEGVLLAQCVPSPDLEDMDEKSQADMLDYLKRIVREISAHFRGGEQYVKTVDEIKSINAFVSYLSRFMPMSAEERYQYLKTDSVKQRGLQFMDALLKQRESIELNMELNEKLSDEANRYYRKQVLREQLKAIQAELGEGESQEDGGEGGDDYARRIEDAGMPEEAKKAALAELKKLSGMGQGGAEESVVRNYLDFMLSLPWKKSQAGDIDLDEARRILDAQHYGLDKVKERIIQHLAVMELKKDNKGSILLLVGPPGTGKTSLGRSIAEALGRKYVRLSLGGIRDEAEIRGHRRTYVGAMPGRILQSIKTAGVNNPVMVLDEVDKLMTGGFSGDPASALLEVLDPEQNNSFTDHYLDQPFDLSDVFFIATANSMDTIPGPLLDRMEIIQISGYTEEEKFHIGKEHLLPDVLSDHGLTAEQLQIDDERAEEDHLDYTLEAGVRGTEKAAGRHRPLGFGEDRFQQGGAAADDTYGRAGGAAGPAGIPPRPRPAGQPAGCGDGPGLDAGGRRDTVHRGHRHARQRRGHPDRPAGRRDEGIRPHIPEPAEIRLPLSAVNFRERDMHIHVPSGAVPKDGPSAGIALFTALASLFTGVKVDPDLP
jgi:ATP-dependent Lon protease